MICADFLAGANLDGGDPQALLHSMTCSFQFLPGEQHMRLRSRWPRRLQMLNPARPKRPRLTVSGGFRITLEQHFP
jgi:hypothetical protein